MRHLFEIIFKSFKQKQQDKKDHEKWIKTFKMIDEWRKEQDEQDKI